MQITIDVKNSAIDKILYLLEHLKEDVTIISRTPVSDLDIEVIEENDPDYGYVKEAREARKNGEKTYSLDEVFDSFPPSSVGMHT